MTRSELARMSWGFGGKVCCSLASMMSLQETGAVETRGRQNIVIMKYHMFKPSVFEVSEGTTVIWMNEDQDPHMVVSDATPEKGEGAWFSSEKLLEGWSFSHTFSEAGEFPYHCPFYPEMKGKIVVYHA